MGKTLSHFFFQFFFYDVFEICSLNDTHFFLVAEKVNFLGISIVGQSNKRGDGGIYVGSIMKG